MRTIAVVVLIVISSAAAKADLIYEFGGTPEVLQADSIYAYGLPAEYLRFEIRTGGVVETTFGDDFIDFDVQQNASLELRLLAINEDVDQSGNPVVTNRFRLDRISMDVLSDSELNFSLARVSGGLVVSSSLGVANAGEETPLIFERDPNSILDGALELLVRPNTPGQSNRVIAPTRFRISNMQIEGEVYHIPEPSGIALAGTASGLVMIYLRRRKRNTSCAASEG